MTWLIVSYPKQNPKTASDLLWRNEILLPINTTRLNQCTKEGRTPTGLDEGGPSGEDWGDISLLLEEEKAKNWLKNARKCYISRIFRLRRLYSF